MSRRRSAVGRGRVYLVLRAFGGATTIAATIAFIPLGLVLSPARWLVGTALAWIVAALGLAGLMRRHPAAYLTPLVLLAGWYGRRVLEHRTGDRLQLRGRLEAEAFDQVTPRVGLDLPQMVERRSLHAAVG